MADVTLVPQINKLFRLQFEKAQQCFVLLYPEGMVKLNDSAGEIMQLIDGELTAEEIIHGLMLKFPEAGDLKEDILDFLQTAHEKKWIYYV